MPFRVRGVLVTFGALLAFLCHESPLEAGTVAGVVRNASGSSLSGMRVQAYAADGVLASQILSSTSGSWSLALATGTYRLLAFDPAGLYATDYFSRATSFVGSTAVAVGDCATLTGYDFALPIAGSLRGLASDAQTRVGLLGITVAAYNVDGSLRATARTDASGVFRLGVPPGTYRLAAFDDAVQYATQFWSGTDQFENALAVSVGESQIIGSLDFLLPRAGVVAGTVRDALTGAPLAGRMIQLYTAEGTKKAFALTGLNGTYSIASGSGSFKVVASDPLLAYRRSYYPGALSFAASPALPVTPGQTLGGIDFALSLSSSSTDVELFVVAAANSGGANGTYFRTDLTVLNLSAAASAQLSLTWLPSGGGDNSSAPPVLRTVAAAGQALFIDAVASLFDAGGGGAIRVSSNQPLAVSTRTYTSAGAGGSFGLGIPGAGRSRALQSGRLTGITTDAVARTNVGFLNPSAAPVTIALTLSDSAGVTLASGNVTLGAYGHFQASTIASYLGVSGPVRNASLRLTAPLPFFAYATVIDQISGDSSFFAAEPD
ncbi:MAG: carboxypeptidase regulatory-like domain-containing protein [Thermoanaerobaculia bacterium]